MVEFRRATLSNGITALVHQDTSTPLMAFNLLVDAGSKYDPSHRTGLAHLYEHLRFSGTEANPDFDRPMQMAGAENNAYTNADYATFYAFGPAQNIETVLWLEHDRLSHLHINQPRLDLEKKVVMEEFRETCLNEPFGDLWHHMLPATYPQHSYRWPTIGASLDDIASYELSDIEHFHRHLYRADRMVVSLAGHLEEDVSLDLLEKWIGSVQLSTAPDQGGLGMLSALSSSEIVVDSQVPASALYMVFRVPERLHGDYIALDLLTEILAGGRTSILYRELVREHQIFSQIDCYLSGAIEGGLLLIEGRLATGINFEQAESEIWKIVDRLSTSELSPDIFSRLKNSMETSVALGEMGILNKAINLGYYQLLGDAARINKEIELYRACTAAQVKNVCASYIRPDACLRVKYKTPVE